MKKKFFCIFLILIAFVIIMIYTRPNKNNQTIQNAIDGYDGEVLEDADTDSDTYIESEEKETESAKEKREDENVALETEKETDKVDASTDESNPEKSAGESVIRENTYDGDLIEPPAVESAVDL